MTELGKLIIDRIGKEGPISFKDYMEMALYYPRLGYYQSDRNKVGYDGDFFTSATMTPLFGSLIAKQLAQMWDILGTPAFSIVEYGAGTGALCNAILDHFKAHDPRYDHLSYYIIEKGEAMRAREKKEIRHPVRWAESIDELGKLTGCVLSNELLDNFAVHRVVMQEQLMEVFVGYDTHFREELRPAGKELNQYFSDLKVELPKGFQAEINLEAEKWLAEISRALEKGYVMTIDYGGPSGELYAPSRRNGTIICYHNHKVNENFYHHPGSQDITAHVNFSALALFGARNGLGFSGFREQGKFLIALGLQQLLRENSKKEANAVAAMKKENLLLKTLVDDMGSKFKVLVQNKNVPGDPLIGFTPLAS